MVVSFTAALEASVISLDGGLGTLLEARGNDVSSALWSAVLLRDNPNEVVAAHREYFESGARVATTCSYQVSSAGFDPDDMVHMLQLSVSLARQARTEANLSDDEAWIAASIGPFGASRADGSEYTGVYGNDVGVNELRAWHRGRIRTLAASGADLLLCETVPSLDEVRALAAELAELDGTVATGISLTVADGMLRSGEPIADAMRIAEAAGISVVGVNCSTVADTNRALEIMSAATSLPLIAYPNSGEVWDAKARAWSGDPTAVAAAVPRWIELGARLVGGCCRVDTAEIAKISQAVEATQPQR